MTTESKAFDLPFDVMCPDDVTLTPARFELYRVLYREKYEIISERPVNSILEIGVRAGYSAWAFLLACPLARYVGLDPHNGTHGGKGGENYAYENWARRILAGYNVELHRIDTQKESDLSRFGSFDFIHVDGDHTADGVEHDLDLSFHVLNPDGRILVDDYTYLPEVKRGVDSWIVKNAHRISHRFIETVRGDVCIEGL